MCRKKKELIYFLLKKKKKKTDKRVFIIYIEHDWFVLIYMGEE
jgi:hypothetical protein